MTPRCFMRLYLPQRHSQSVIGPKMRAQKRPSRSGFNVRQLMVSGLGTSPCDQLRIFSGLASWILMASKSAIGPVSSKGLERNIFTSPLQRLLRFSTCLLLGDGGTTSSLITFCYFVLLTRVAGSREH